MEAFPLKHPELCITLLQNRSSLLNQSLGKAGPGWFASCLIKARRLWGLAFQFITKCDTLGRGTLGPALQDVTSVEESWCLPLLICILVLSCPPTPHPTPGCLCSINLWNRAQFVISPWSLFLLISLQNRSTWMLLFKSLMCSSCQAVVWAASSALTRQWELVFICWLHCQGRKHCRKRQQKNTTVELQAESLGRGHVCRRENLCDQ